MNDFTAVNEFFDHIYVITLHRAHERHKAIKKNLEGLKYEFFWGADKLDHPISELVVKGIYNEELAVQNHRYHKRLTGGQVCCALSHRMVYEDVLHHGYQKVLVLEDDVIALANIGIISPFVFAELPQHWELLYMDYDKNEVSNPVKQYWYHIQKFFGGLTWSHTTIHNLYPRKVSEHLKYAGFHDFTSAYAITATAAQKLLTLQSPVAYVADNLLATACTTKLVTGLITIPKLFTQLSQGPGNGIESFVAEQ